MPSFLDIYLFLTGLTGITKTIITSILNGDWCIIPVYFDSRYIVGEVRGDETVDMISSAMLNGHSGSMSTGHSNNPADMLHRLETMMMMGIDLPLVAIQRQVASAIDIIIHLGRLRDKTRKLLSIVEVLGYEDGKIQMQTLYEFREEGCKNEKVQGAIVKVEELVHRDKLLAAGYPA